MSGSGLERDGTWRLIELTGPDGSVVGVPSGVRATATVAGGRISGSTGCNRYSGAADVDGPHLRLGPLASTMRACPDPEMAVESAFLAALGRTASWVVDGDRLELRDAGGAPVLAFLAEPPPALTDGEWRATGINNGRGAVQGLVGDTTVTASFSAEGRVSGSGGCNRFMASYEAAEGTIRIGPVGSTRMACPDTAIAAQEAAYFAALERATRYELVDLALELRDDDGALQVGFAPATPPT